MRIPFVILLGALAVTVAGYWNHEANENSAVSFRHSRSRANHQRLSRSSIYRTALRDDSYRYQTVYHDSQHQHPQDPLANQLYTRHGSTNGVSSVPYSYNRYAYQNQQPSSEMDETPSNRRSTLLVGPWKRTTYGGTIKLPTVPGKYHVTLPLGGLNLTLSGNVGNEDVQHTAPHQPSTSYQIVPSRQATSHQFVPQSNHQARSHLQAATTRQLNEVYQSRPTEGISQKSSGRHVGVFKSLQRGSVVIPRNGATVRVPATSGRRKAYRGTIRTTVVNPGTQVRALDTASRRRYQLHTVLLDGRNAQADSGYVYVPSSVDNNNNVVHDMPLDASMCIRCPKDRTVLASKGTSCALVSLPDIKLCDRSVVSPVVSFDLIYGPQPGSLAGEGTHVMVVRVSHLGHPLRTCQFRYNVEVRKCEPLSVPDHMTLHCSHDLVWGSECTFICDPGYQLLGYNTTECEAAGDSIRWSNPVPDCVETSCPKPMSPINGRLTCETPSVKLGYLNLPHGSVCTYECEPGYAIPHSQSHLAITSCSNGEWNSTMDPSCDREQCVVPEAPANGEVVCSSTSRHAPVGGTCAFTCSGDYVIPSSQITLAVWSCGNKGSWNQSKVPECSRAIPPDPVDCIDRSIQISHQDTLELGLPQFFTYSGTPAKVTCDVNEIIKAGDVLRTCVAEDPELGTTTTCQYQIFAHEEAPKPLLQADLHFNVSLEDCSHTSRLDRIMGYIKEALFRKNREFCTKIDCSGIQFMCASDSIFPEESILTTSWSLRAPLIDEDFYDQDVSQGESVIEDIQVETENMIVGGSEFQTELQDREAELDPSSFRLGQFDVVCSGKGYVFEEDSGKCVPCPPGTFQEHTECKPCPAGTFQDNSGKAECKPCDPESSGNADGCKDGETNNSISFVPTKASKGNFKLPQVRSHRLRGPSHRGHARRSGPHKPVVMVRAGRHHAQPWQADESSEERYFDNQVVPVQVAIRAPRLNSRRKNGSNLHETPTTAVPTETIMVPLEQSDEAGDVCDPNPCQAGGTCLSGLHNALCICPSGYEGTFCERARCSAHYCLHGGTCQVVGWRITCACSSGYTGHRCESPFSIAAATSEPTVIRNDIIVKPEEAEKTAEHNKLGFCESGPCQNGGRCVDNSHVGFYTCKCRQEYVGRHCEHIRCPIQFSRHYCHHGGACIVVNGAMSCLCPKGRGGSRCQLRLDGHSSRGT